MGGAFPDDPPEVADVAAELVGLLALLELARDAEWATPDLGSVETAGRRIAGEHADPTESLATNRYRLAVRGAVWGSWRACREARESLGKALGAA